MKSILAFVFALGALVPTAAFAADSSKIKEKAAETTAAVGDYVKDNQDEFEKHMQADVDGLKAQIEVLRAKAMHSSGAVQDKLDKQIADLDVKRMILNKRLGDSAKNSGKAWTEVKSGLSKAFDDLKSSFAKAKETAAGVPDAVPAPAPAVKK